MMITFRSVEKSNLALTEINQIAQLVKQDLSPNDNEQFELPEFATPLLQVNNTQMHQKIGI